LKIAVFGSAVSTDARIITMADAVGKAIAECGATIVTGGCAGLPGAAAESALQHKGSMIGYSPGRDAKEHASMGLPEIKGTAEYIPKDYKHAGNLAVCLKYRNVTSCADADACVIIGGRIGTLNEFTNMFDMGKVIGVLEGVAGTSGLIRKIIEISGKESGARLIYDTDPYELVHRIMELVENGA